MLSILSLFSIGSVFGISFKSVGKSFLKLIGEKSLGIILSIISMFAIFSIHNGNILSINQFELVEESHNIGNYNFYLGTDGMSIYFIILIGIILPISILSNWSSITENIKSFLIIILLLETLLLIVFIGLDTLLFYIFFESILPPLFLLIGIFGAKDRVRAAFYLFMYTLLGSLFLLLCILIISLVVGAFDFDMTYKYNFIFYLQAFTFSGIFFAFAIKTPTIFLNNWLLKAHVESPLSGSIILAAIVLKLSIYGIIRLILPYLYKAATNYIPIVYTICTVTILYAGASTLRTIDIKELIAYSSVSHAAVYLLGIFSNIVQGIQGSILLGIGHGFVSSGLFACTGGVLYDRSSTRSISFYRGFGQTMPLFAILLFILCLGNAGTPLTVNFVGEFMSLFGAFEKMPFLGSVSCSSIVLAAAYSIYLFNRIVFGGTLSEHFRFNLPDLSKREFNILLILVIFTVVLGVYPAPILDGLHYSTSLLIYNLSNLTNYCDSIDMWDVNLTNNNLVNNLYYNLENLSKLHNAMMYAIILVLFSVTLFLVGTIFSILFKVTKLFVTWVNKLDYVIIIKGYIICNTNNIIRLYYLSLPLLFVIKTIIFIYTYDVSPVFLGEESTELVFGWFNFYFGSENINLFYDDNQGSSGNAPSGSGGSVGSSNNAPMGNNPDDDNENRNNNSQNNSPKDNDQDVDMKSNSSGENNDPKDNDQDVDMKSNSSGEEPWSNKDWNDDSYVEDNKDPRARCNHNNYNADQEQVVRRDFVNSDRGILQAINLLLEKGAILGANERGECEKALEDIYEHRSNSKARLESNEKEGKYREYDENKWSANLKSSKKIVRELDHVKGSWAWDEATINRLDRQKDIMKLVGRAMKQYKSNANAHDSNNSQSSSSSSSSDNN